MGVVSTCTSGKTTKEMLALEVSVAQDDLILIGAGRRCQRGRGAKWKQWLPRALLRVGFGDLALNQRAVSSEDAV